MSYHAAVVGVDEPEDSAPRAVRLRVSAAAGVFVAASTTAFLIGIIATVGLTTTVIANQDVLQRIGGVITVVMGLAFTGFIAALQRQVRFTLKGLPTIGGAPLLGAVFGLGWALCPGPPLTGVGAVTSTTGVPTSHAGWCS